MHFQRLEQQISFFKNPASQTTTSDAKLFAIRLGIAKTTSINIEHIILTTNSLSFARKIVDPSIHSEQAYSLAVCFILFFSYSLNYRIEFQNCLSNTGWFLHQLVYNDVTNNRVAAGLYSATFINTLHSKSVLSYLNIWRTSFNCPTVQVYYFLTLRDKNHKPLQPSYSKDSSWLLHIGQSVTLYTRVTRAILNHTSIREYRQQFFLVEYICYDSKTLELINEQNLILGLTQENSIENSVQNCLSYILKPHGLYNYYFSLSYVFALRSTCVTHAV